MKTITTIKDIAVAILGFALFQGIAWIGTLISGCPMLEAQVTLLIWLFIYHIIDHAKAEKEQLKSDE